MSLSASSAAPAIDGSALFAKTAKGRAEVAQRSAGLSARQRSILIMLDGSTPLAAMSHLLPPAELQAVVDHLRALGLITPGTTLALAPTAANEDGLAAPQLAAIKHFMAEAARRCLGLMAAELARRIEQAATSAQLLALLGHWHMAMHESKHGKPFALQHMAQLKASFAGAPCPSIEMTAA